MNKPTNQSTITAPQGMPLDTALKLYHTWDGQLHTMKQRFFFTYDCIRKDYFKDWKNLEEKIEWINGVIADLRAKQKEARNESNSIG